MFNLTTLHRSTAQDKIGQDRRGQCCPPHANVDLLLSILSGPTNSRGNDHGRVWYSPEEWEDYATWLGGRGEERTQGRRKRGGRTGEEGRGEGGRKEKGEWEGEEI